MNTIQDITDIKEAIAKLSTLTSELADRLIALEERIEEREDE